MSPYHLIVRWTACFLVQQTSISQQISILLPFYLWEYLFWVHSSTIMTKAQFWQISTLLIIRWTTCLLVQRPSTRTCVILETTGHMSLLPICLLVLTALIAPNQPVHLDHGVQWQLVLSPRESEQGTIINVVCVCTAKEWENRFSRYRIIWWLSPLFCTYIVNINFSVVTYISILAYLIFAYLFLFFVWY